jgi:hypothetical protein
MVLEFISDTLIKTYLTIQNILLVLGTNCRSYTSLATILFGRSVKPPYLLVTRIRIYDKEDRRTR